MPNEKNIFFIQNRSEIITHHIVIVLIILFVILIGYIIAHKTVLSDAENQYQLKTDTLNSKYLDQKNLNPAANENNTNEIVPFDYSKSIICWGDSFSDNSANSTSFYTYRLSELILETSSNINGVFSSGLEGDNVSVIAAKQGGIPMQAEPFTIPASTTPVEISLKSTLGVKLILQDKLNSGLNPCAIAGVEGNIEYVRGKLCFTRSKAGKEIKVVQPTTVVTNSMTNIKDYTAIYFFGGDCTEYTPEELVSMYKKMITFVGNEKYIIVGSVTGNEATLAPYEEALNKEFKNHYINLRKYLTTTVFNDYEVKITTNDAKALREGSVPPSFILNGKRLSDSGSTILADLLYDKLLQLQII